MAKGAYKPLGWVPVDRWGLSKLDSEKISIKKLSELTGFPVDFIKKEFLFDEDEISVGCLRNVTKRYLDSIYGESPEENS